MQSKSNAFNEVEAKFWRGFMQMCGRLLQNMEEDFLSHSNLTNQEYEVLLQISWSKEGKLRLQDLAAESLLSRSGMTRLVNRLEKSQLIRKTEVPEDKRGAYVSLTAAGLKKFNFAKTRHIDFIRKNFLDHFSTDEQKLMTKFCDRINQLQNPAE